MNTPQECTVFDLRVTQQDQERGIPRYLRNLINQIAKDDQERTFYFMLDKKKPRPFFFEEFKAFGHFFDVEEGNLLFKKRRIRNYFISCFPMKTETPFSFLFPEFLCGHSPYILGMLWDLIPLLFSHKYLTSPASKMLIAAFAAMREADHLFTISKNSAQDAVRILNIAETKITNIYGGVAPEILEELQKSSNNEHFYFGALNPGKYFVYIGGNDYRKNIPRLIQAFAILWKNHNQKIDYPLIIICSLPKEKRDELEKLIESYGLKPKKQVILSGQLCDSDLVTILKNAKAMIFPSLYEGLGLPILESYACGTPVIASCTSSMPEIVHPLCLFDPYDSQAIAKKILAFINDPRLSRLSMEFGKEILKKLSWQQASAQVISHLCRKANHKS